MLLSYEEFKKIVPVKTTIFFENLTYALYYYTLLDNAVILQNGLKTKDKNIRELASIIYAMSCDDDYAPNIKKFNIKCPNFKDIPKSAILSDTTHLLYKKYASDLIPEYPNKIYYSELLPIDIINKGFTYIYYNTNITSSEFEQLFPSKTETEEDIKRTSTFLHQESEKKVIDRLFKDLPTTTVILLEKANHFYSLLTSSIGCQEENPDIVIDRDNAVPLSILLALFSCAKEYSVEDKINEYEELTLYLESKGINMDSILAHLNIELEDDNEEEEKKNLIPLMTIYKPYFENSGTISVFEVFSRLFDRNISPQPVIQKILLEHKIDPEVFKNYQMDKSLLERQKIKSKVLDMNSIRKFYFKPDIDNFLCLAIKAYQVILEKVQQGGYNEQLLTNDADYFQLALYFASVYKKHSLGNYLCENGITPEEVLKHLQIDISKQEIMSQKLKPQFYLDKEHSFRNLSNSTLNWATPYFINFGNSLLIERLICEINPVLFSEIRDNDQNLADAVKQYEDDKKERLSKKRQHRYLKDMPNELVRVLRTASKFDKELHYYTDYDDKDIISLSLLLSILQDDDSKVRRFLYDKGLNYEKVKDYILYDDDNSFLAEHDDLDIEDTDEDIDLLIDKYGSIVFGGANQGLKKSDLSIINICKNIFSKSYHVGTKFSDLLEALCFDFDEFKDIDLQFQKFVADDKHSKAVQRMNRRLDNYTERAREYIKDVVRIHKRIVDNGKILNRCIPIELRDDDIEMLSFVLALFNDENLSNYQEFLREQNIDQKSILSFIGIDDPNKIFADLQKDEVSPYIYDEHYEKYAIKTDQNGHYMNLLNSLFKVNNSSILKDICNSLGGNYDTLVETLKVSSIHDLSFPQKLNHLRNITTERLDCNDIKSVLGFGKKLEIHNKYLNGSFLPSLHFGLDTEVAERISRDFDSFLEANHKSTSTKNRSIFGKRQQTEPTKITGIDDTQMYFLNKTLETELDKLKEELLHFAAKKTYLEVYRDKNMDYLDAVNDAYEKMLNKVDSETVCEILRAKRDKFDIAISSSNRELRIISQNIVNYFITINAIEIVKDSLLPVVNVEFESDRKNERIEENNALLDCVVKFAKAVLFHDSEGIESYGEELKSTDAFKDITPAISSEINTLIESIKVSKDLEKDSSKEQKAKSKTINYMAV